MAEESEERGNSEGFIAFRDDLEVYGVPVKPEAEERGSSIDRDHKENADDTMRGLAKEDRARSQGTYCLCWSGFV